jgi:hypothetical protein
MSKVSSQQVIAVVGSRSLSGKFMYRCFMKTKLTIDVRGINEGRQSAREVDLYLEKSTSLPVTGGIVKQSALEILGS